VHSAHAQTAVPVTRPRACGRRRQNPARRTHVGSWVGTSCDGHFGASCTRRHRTDKYLDTVLANQTARKASPPIIPKVAVARWRIARVIIFLTVILTCVTSQRSRSAITNDVSSAVRRIAKCGVGNLRPSCDYRHSGGCAPVVAHTKVTLIRKATRTYKLQ